MESNVEVAVRVCPVFYDEQVEAEICVTPNIYNNTIHLCNSINSHTFPVNYALPAECTQNALFVTTVTPLLNFFLEGCDVSVVTYGHSSSCGKSYTLLGPAPSCALSESEYGIVPRFVREVFNVTSQRKERNSTVHITWSQICGENVRDLLGVGSLQCTTVGQVFDIIQLGFTNLTTSQTEGVHTLFTVTLEQHWKTDATVRQHRVSTASFVDLSSSKLMYIMNDNGITDAIVNDLNLMALQKCVWVLSEPENKNVVPYEQSTLTTLLKDSFGGRSKTLVISCISSLFRDYVDTFRTLEFAIRSQSVRNYVTVNSYTTYDNFDNSTDTFGLQFAADQLLQLVCNAENLFNNLIMNGSLSKSQIQQISKWLTLKQECDDCISESSEPHRSLDIIKEEIEGTSESTSVTSEDETSNDSFQQLDQSMELFRSKTENLVADTNIKCISQKKTVQKCEDDLYNEFHSKGARGRRCSIHGSKNDNFDSLQNAEASQIGTSTSSKGASQTVDSYDTKLKTLKETCSNIESCEKQIQELELTVKSKEKYLRHLSTYKSQNASTREKLKKSCSKLKNEESKARSKMLRAKSENDTDGESKYYAEVCKITKKLSEAEIIKDLTESDPKKIGQAENSLRNSKKELEKLKKLKGKEEKQKKSIEAELEKFCSQTKSTNNSKECLKTLSHENEDCRHEIKELRKTRDLLLQHRDGMNKSHSIRTLKRSDETKLFQCEEAIEIVDLAIERKNRMLCDSMVPYDEEALLSNRDFVDRLLLEQLLKLDTRDMRALLAHYFIKVIDLRSSAKKLENQLTDVEVHNENLLSRVQSLGHALLRVRLESERRIVSLEQQHEDKLQLMISRFIPNREEQDDENNVMSGRVVKASSKQASLAFKMAQGGASKQIDKGSLIAKVTRYARARHEVVPKQLQPAITQATVTRAKNKLIIQQSNK